MFPWAFSSARATVTFLLRPSARTATTGIILTLARLMVTTDLSSSREASSSAPGHGSAGSTGAFETGSSAVLDTAPLFGTSEVARGLNADRLCVDSGVAPRSIADTPCGRFEVAPPEAPSLSVVPVAGSKAADIDN